MGRNDSHDTIPFRATHPGYILKDELEARGIKQKDFAKSIEMHSSHLNEIIKGKRDINASIAMKLERELNISYDFWMNLQSNYERNCLAIEKRDAANADADNWLSIISEKFNLHELLKRLDIDEFFSSKRLESLTEKLGFNHPSEIIEAIPSFGNFKKSDKVDTDERNLNTWLLLVHSKINRYEATNPYLGNLEEVANGLAAMANSRTLGKENVRELFKDNGIIFIEEPKMEKVPVDAYSTWREDIPVIAVTYRYGNDADKLAFNLLHELGHLKYHHGQSFLNVKDYDRSDPTERQADEFAEDCLIPPKVWKEILSVSVDKISPQIVVKKLEEKAAENGISPSIASYRYLYMIGSYNIKRTKHATLD